VDSARTSHRESPFAGLRRFAPKPSPAERCDLCSAALAADHGHLIDPVARELRCACDACSLLFRGQSSSKFKRVPRRIRALRDFELSDGQWDDLAIPIAMAFFFHSSPAGRVVAIYPSPAGPTESLLTLEAWEAIESANPVLRDLEPDVEALLVNRIGGATGSASCFTVPIDECYKLVGLIRANWRGLSGGAEVWSAIEEFFTSLRSRAIGASEVSRA